MNRHEIYRPLLERTLENFQLQHLARRFDFGSESRVAAILVHEVNSRMDEVEGALGMKRVKPFELYLKNGTRNGEDLILPLCGPEFLEPMLSGAGFSYSREMVVSSCLERLQAVLPAACKRDVLALINPWALVRRRGPRRYVDQLVEDILPPSDGGPGRIREMIDSIHPLSPMERAGKLDLMAPEPVLRSLGSFVAREAGLGPVVARKLVEEVVSLRNIVCPRAETLNSGEMPLLATHVRAYPSEETRTRFRRLAPVIVSVYAPGERALKPPSLPTFLKHLQKRIVRVCFEAYRQNGLLTLMDLQWIFQINSSRISELIRSFQKEHSVVVPTPGTVLDAGRSITHKDVIINLHLAGYSVMEIAKRTYHSPRAVDNYVGTFESILILYLFGLPPHLMSRVLGRSPGLIREHLELVRDAFGDGNAVRDFLRKKGVKIPTIAS